LSWLSHMFAAGIFLGAPAEIFLLESASRGELPFRLGWQTLACPPRVRFCVLIGHLDYRMIIYADNVAVGPLRMAPTGAGHEAPRF
jgi:hypothetical protein